MHRWLVGCLLLLDFSGDASAQGRPLPPRAEQLAAPNRPGWVVEHLNGCWVWRPYPRTDEVTTWSGGCAPDGRAAGHGVLESRRNDGQMTRYEGEMRDGHLNGSGTYADPAGNRYTGDWQDDRRHGRGIMTLANGQRYEGEWRDGAQNGQGVLSSPNGDRYEGEWQNGKQHGRGSLYLGSGRYVGEWHEGRQHGQGTMTSANGNHYRGEWRHGKRHGRGIADWVGGDRYEGEWQDDRPHGHGEFWHTGSTQRYIGAWRAGCFYERDKTLSIGRPTSECK